MPGSIPITSLPKLDNLEGSAEGGSVNGTVLIVMTIIKISDKIINGARGLG